MLSVRAFGESKLLCTATLPVGQTHSTDAGCTDSLQAGTYTHKTRHTQTRTAQAVHTEQRPQQSQHQKAVKAAQEGGGLPEKLQPHADCDQQLLITN